MPNPDPTYIAQLMVSRIPEPIRKAIGPRELNRRLVEAARLTAQSKDESLPPALRRAAGLKAAATLEAQPAAATREQHRVLLQKAAACPPRQAEAIRRQAAELLEANPIAPDQAAPVVKARGTVHPGAGSSLRVAVYNAHGRFAGLIFPDRIRPEIPKGAAPKGKGGVPLCAVFDENGKLLGVIDPDDLVPVDSGGKPAADPEPAVPAAPAPAPGPASAAQVVKSSSRHTGRR